MPADVFISYSSNDQDRVVKLADKLRSAGVSIWVDESGIGAATLWSKEIAGAIKGCKVLVLMVTPNSVKSKNVVKEVSLAAEQNKQILPVILEPTEIPEALEYHLAGIQHLNVGGMSASESAEEILPALLRLLGMESEEAAAPGHGVRGSRRRSFNIWADWRLYACGLLIGALVWFLKPSPSSSPPPVYHAEAVLGGERPVFTGLGSAFALSRDGNQFVYTKPNPTESGSAFRLLLRRLDKAEDKELQISEGAYGPFFSPDGQSVGFVTPSELKIAHVSGGEEHSLAAVSRSRGAAWGADGIIVYSPNPNSGLNKVSATGDEPTELTSLDEGEVSHRWPQFLPDGKHVLFTAYKSTTGDPGHIKVVDIKKSGQPKSVLQGGTYAHYAESGHLLYVNNGMLHAAPFDPAKLKVTGPAAQLHKVVAGSSGGAQYAVAQEAGTLVYLPGKEVTEGIYNLVWSDEQGNLSPIPVPIKTRCKHLELSPDDERVAMVLDHDIQVMDIQRGTLRRLTVNEGLDTNPLWSPDGEWIAFWSDRGGKPVLWRRRADWSQDAEVMFELENSSFAPGSFSADGKDLVYSRIMDQTGWDIWIYRMEGGKAEHRSLVHSRFNEIAPVLSPDGGSIAYESDESGVGNVYISPSDGSGGIKMVSVDGGAFPRWSEKGDRLFYLTGKGIWSVEVTTEGGVIQLGSPSKIIEIPSGTPSRAWDVSSDGNRFLFAVNETGTDFANITADTPNSVNIVFNFFTELNEKVPVGNE